MKGLVRLLTALFRGRPIVVPGTDRLAEGEAKKVDIGDVAAGGMQLVLCRRDGVLHALNSYCPHEGGRMQGGSLIGGKFLMCPVHQYLFDPANGRAVRGSCRSATTYKVEEKDGAATVWL